jgi:hypothetical protein
MHILKSYETLLFSTFYLKSCCKRKTKFDVSLNFFEFEKFDFVDVIGKLAI